MGHTGRNVPRKRNIFADKTDEVGGRQKEFR
jgi:hypothetical protein